jgi:hypothetical protein
LPEPVLPTTFVTPENRWKRSVAGRIFLLKWPPLQQV